MSKGPAASPSSQMETRRMDAEVSSEPERSRMILSAIGTTPMHVNVLFEKISWDSEIIFIFFEERKE